MAKESKFNRSGVRRAGDDYQDAQALTYLVSMLEHPGRYEWVKVEASEYGYLDDIVIKYANGDLELLQVKFAAHPDEPDDAYNWESLLKTRTGKKGKELPSLIKKWGDSILDLHAQEEVFKSSLVTNRKLAPEIESCLDTTNLTIDLDKIPDKIITELKRQIGPKEQLNIVFGNLVFKTDQPECEVLESSCLRRFQAVSGKNEGWLNLKDNLKKWIKEKDLPNTSGEIKIHDVQNAALWYRLQSLPQEFEIPYDYILPSEQFFQEVNDASLTAGCSVICGTPGVGKSTFISYLFRHLQNQNRDVVRHHYFLSLDDNSTGRFDHNKVAESLMADLQIAASEALAKFIDDNPNPSDFAKWLDQCNKYYIKHSRPLVIIIDGLDHVWRERRNISELLKLFEIILPCRPGISIIIGTQPVPDEQLPERLLSQAPRNQWKELPWLTEEAIAKLLQKQESLLSLRWPKERQKDELLEISSILYEKTQGHPLVLKFTFQTLLDSGKRIERTNVSSLNSWNGDNIESYYSSLWRSLSSEGRFVLCLFAVSGFVFPEDGLITVCTHARFNPAESQNGFRTVRHLLTRSALGWRAFHQSLDVFVRKSAELPGYASIIASAITQWLDNNAPEYWQWAYLWRWQSKRGNSEPLITGITREWVIDSISKGYPLKTICQITEHSAISALRTGDLYHFVKNMFLKEYAQDQAEYKDPDSFSKWNIVQLFSSGTPLLTEILLTHSQYLSDPQLYGVAQKLAVDGKQTELQTVVAELLQRIRKPKSRQNKDWQSEVKYLIGSKAYSETLTTKELIDIIKRNRSRIDTVELCKTICESLAHANRTSLIHSLANEELEQGERDILLNIGFQHALFHNLNWNDLADQYSNNPFSYIYKTLNNRNTIPTKNFTLPNHDILNIKHMYQNKKQVISWLEDTYFTVLANYLSDQSDVIDDWKKGIGDYTWAREFTGLTIELAFQTAINIKEGNPFTIVDVYDHFSQLEPPKFNGDDKQYDFYIQAKKSLLNIGFMLSSIFYKNITKDHIKNIFNSRYCYWTDWIGAYVKNNYNILSNDTVLWIIENKGILSDFSTRDIASDGMCYLTDLAQFASIHSLHNHAMDFLKHAVELMVSYGYHKDVFFFDCLKTIEVLSETNADEARQLITPLMPAILNVGKYTDGDETHHLPEELFELLSSLSPLSLLECFEYYCAEEEYYRAQNCFENIVKIINLDDPVGFELASTVLDKGSLDILIKSGDKGTSIHNAVEAFLGKRSNVKEVQNNNHTIPVKKVTLAAKDYPPEKLQAYFEKGRSYLAEDKINIALWVQFWKETNPRETYAALEELYTKEPSLNCGGILYELCFDLEGKEKAWKWLISSFCENNSWTSYWSAKIDAEKAWKEVSKHYPERWLEFLQETLSIKRHDWHRIGVFRRVERMTEYLLMMKQDSEAIKITEAICETGLELTSSFALESPTLEITEASFTQEHLIKLLLMRLSWPSGMVRERACNSLGKLILRTDLKIDVIQELTNWINSQKLESLACIGLLPFIRAKQIDPSLIPVSIDSFARKSCNCSHLFKLLLYTINPNQIDTACTTPRFDVLPRGFKPSPDFIKHYDKIIPSAYKYTSEEISIKYNISFIDRWAYETEKLGFNLKNADKPFHDFWGRHDDQHFMVFDCLGSEIFRSGYLMALQWLQTSIPSVADCTEIESTRTLPIDLGLWKVSPSPPPEWWPFIDLAEGVDITPNKIISKLEVLFEEQKKWAKSVGMISGRVASGDVFYDIEMFAVGQKCIDGNTPDGESIFNSGLWRTTVKNYSPSQLATIERGIKETDDLQEEVIGGWYMQPYAQYIRSVPTARWQWWRAYRNTWAPSHNLFPNSSLTVCCQPDRVEYLLDNKVIGYWKDWTKGITEYTNANLSPSSGCYLMLDKEIVKNTNNIGGLTTCWVCKITCYHRKYSHEQFQSHEIFKVIGGSNIIV